MLSRRLRGWRKRCSKSIIYAIPEDDTFDLRRIFYYKYCEIQSLCTTEADIFENVAFGVALRRLFQPKMTAFLGENS